MKGRGTTWGALVAGAVLLATGHGRAEANGNNTHVWITQQAVQALPDGALKDFLSLPESQVMLLNGAMFPDGGYVIEDDYGEMAHWSPFQSAYAGWIARTFPRPFTYGEAAPHVAFLFGMASHGMADQVFDSQFMEIARVYDADGWANGLLDGFDTATDVFLVADTGVELVFDSWVPADEIAGVFADDLDYTIDPGALYTAQDLLHRVVLSYVRETGLRDPSRVAEYRLQYPWASDNIMDPQVQGSPPCEAAVVAAYWQSLWFRLHQEAGPDLVVATVPGDGGAGHPTDSSLVESQLIVVFGDAMDARTVNDSTITVSDAAGNEVAVAPRFHYGDGTNVLRLAPTQDWAADTVYTVTLAPSIATSDGAELSEPYSFSFSTAAAGAAPIAPCTDPTPYSGEPDVGTPPEMPEPSDESGGCSSAATPGIASGALWLLLMLVTGRRRARTRPARGCAIQRR